MNVAARETGGFAGGMLGATVGGLAGGWVASLACGPGAPVCALIVSVIFVGAGAYLAGRTGEIAGEESLKTISYLPLAFPIHSRSAGGRYAGIMKRDRKMLLDASRPFWMKLNESIKLIQEDIGFLEVRIHSAEDKETLEKI